MPTVLVIDENRATLDAIGRALRTADFSVALASTGEDALSLAVEQAIDLGLRNQSEGTRRFSSSNQFSTTFTGA